MTLCNLIQIETSVVPYLLELVDEADKNKDGKIDYDEWEVMGTFATAHWRSLFSQILRYSRADQEAYPDG